MTVIVHPVTNKSDLRKMLLFPWERNKDDPCWVPPLLPSMISRFNPGKNPVISSGKRAAFIATDRGRVIGSIAAAIDDKRNRTWQENRAIFDFFDCIEEYTVAESLFSTAKQWANEQEASSMRGPLQFDYEDRHGFLMGNHHQRPPLMCAHTEVYYPEFAERSGFKKARRDSLAFRHDIMGAHSGIIPEKLARVTLKVAKKNRITIRAARIEAFEDELIQIENVLNRGLAVLNERGFWDVDRLAAYTRDLRPVIDPELVLIAEDSDRKSVGWILGLPDLNEAIVKADGIRSFWKSIVFLRELRKHPACVRMKSIAVDPAYWNRGVDALLIYEFSKAVIRKEYQWIDMSLTGEDNPMTPRLATNLGASEYKRYRIFEHALPSEGPEE